ncbi:MAG: TlpA disulfide reductase family protein [Thermodesulfobacteriota bacterium]
MRTTASFLTAALLCLAAPGVPWPAFGADKPQPGAAATSFTAPLLEDGDLELGPHLGKDVILLDFWSIYCVACMEEMPKIIDLYERYRERGLVVVGINLDSFGSKRVVRFVEGLDYPIPFPLVIDKRRQVAGDYSVSVLPTTVLIDRQGKVVDYHVGYAPGDEIKLEEKVKQALGGGN